MGMHKELIATLASGALALRSGFAEAGVASGAVAPTGADAAARVFAELRRALAAFGDVAGAAGAVGLQSACLWLESNVRLLAAHGRDLSHFEFRRLAGWPELIGAYVDDDARVRAIDGILETLDAPCWPLRPSRIEIGSIQSNLRSFGAPAMLAEGAQPVRTATVLERFEAAVGRVGADDETGRRAALGAARAAMQALATGAATDAPAGLLEIAPRVDANLQMLEADAALGPSALLVLMDFASLLAAHAAAPDDRDTREALLACLADAAWPDPLPARGTELLRVLLGGPAAAAPADASMAAAAASPVQEAPERPNAQPCDGEQLSVLASELKAFALTLDAELEAASCEAPPERRVQAVATYAELLQRLANVTHAIGLHALKRMLDHVAARVLALAHTGLDSTQRGWLDRLIPGIGAYLAAPAQSAAAVGAMLREPGWPTALDRGEVDEIEAALAAVEPRFDAATRPERPTQANAADVSLAVADDINPELLDSLLAELPVQTAEFTSAIARVASGAGALQDLEVAKRAAHTLKGAANTVGVKGIANLTHQVEDILIALTKHAALPPPTLAETLTLAADCLEAMSEALLGVSPAPDDAQPVLQNVIDWAIRIDRDGEAAFADSDARTAAPVAVAAAAAPRGAAPAHDGEPNAAAPLLRVPAGLVDELLRLVGETMIANTQIKEQLRLTIEHVRSVSRHNQSLQQLTGELETLVDIRGASIPLAAKHAHAGFDALEFEHYNELHTVTRRLVEAATDSKELSAASEERLAVLAELLDVQGRLHLENQNTVMKARMVPVSGIVSRLQRGVRQTCRLLDKQVHLEVHGAATAIDGSILNEIVEPLMHLLRNAIDHGIEAPAQRAACGKPVAGRIDLRFIREGNSIVIRCADDGAGLNPQALRRRGEQLGLVPAGQAMTDDDALRLILLPGFSTRGEASQVSGRGIGLDAVNSRVLALKGTLLLANRPGLGLTVELRLPASLMTTHGLLVRVDNQVVAVANYGVLDIRFVTTGQVRRFGNGQVYQAGDQVHELDRLDTLLGRSAADDARDWFPALMVQTDHGTTRAVRVRDVLDSRELVVKELGRYVARPQGVIGVTILGDGSVAPVIDLPQLLRAPAGAVAAPRLRPERSARPARARRAALVVDDSLSARRAAAQVMKDAGFEVQTAIDGMEAASMIEKQVPDIVLVDMEMPRMNGLEFTTHLRARDGTRAVPVIMITSRSTAKHRQQAAAAGVDVYLTKPFADDELLEHVTRLTAAAVQ